ncbi:MAG: hypothetical protein MUC67_03415 [Acidobacteria bacterium]|jgi:hypothetical protein|nr:hypothetical protein [Acidobacteriota bacterium]
MKLLLLRPILLLRATFVPPARTGEALRLEALDSPRAPVFGASRTPAVTG